MDGGLQVSNRLFRVKHSTLTISEIENLNRMITLFPTTEQIYLEDNYRSTGAILAASIAIISEGNAGFPRLASQLKIAK